MEQVEKLIAEINTEHNTSYKLLKRYEKGEWGAYLIGEPDGKTVVLKFVPSLHDTNIVDPDPELAKTITDRLRSLKYPVPKFLLTGRLQPEGLFWVQEELPGKPLWQDPTKVQVKQIVSLLELQQDQAVSDKQNWSNYVKDTVFKGKSGWSARLKNHSNETASLLENMMKSVKVLENLELPTDDIVHGDFSYHQVMINNGEIAGIIDWQEAGCGDWIIDLTRLMYSLHDRPHLTSPIIEKLKIYDSRNIKLYTIFTALEMIDWPIRKKQSGLSKSIDKARSALNFVEKVF